MTALSASKLLALFDNMAGSLPVIRCLHLLNTAWPETSLNQWAHSSMGQRDDALLTLREELFGKHVEATAECPVCEEILELAFETSEIRTLNDSTNQEGYLETEGYCIKYRLPTSIDLLAVIKERQEVASAESLLLKRCVLSATSSGNIIDIQQLSPELMQKIQHDMSLLDPQAEIMLALNCPQCAHQWQRNFDIAAYLWDEIEAWATRLLREVHILARSYSWREQDILEMSAQRRQSYMEILGT